MYANVVYFRKIDIKWTTFSDYTFFFFAASVENQVTSFMDKNY